jgi:hypothetical protein
MKVVFFFCCFVVSSLCSYGQYNEKNLKMEPVADNRYQYENLRFYPVRANDSFRASHQNVGKYSSLKESLEKKKLVITEYGASPTTEQRKNVRREKQETTTSSTENQQEVRQQRILDLNILNDGVQSAGSVNTLMMENTSKDTIMILSGEVVQGGKQDRMVAEDIILYPGSGKQSVPVFCVEQGRWQPKEQGMEFNEYFSISSSEVRKAATVKKDQSEVWSKVAETTTKNMAETSTGTLTALKQSGSFNKEIQSYTSHFEKAFLQEPDVIGIVAVSGDVILGCDLFASHDLFMQHYTNLMNSYATEAITSGKAVTVSYEKVKQYLQSIIQNESQQESEVQKNGTLLKDGKTKLHISTF